MNNPNPKLLTKRKTDGVKTKERTNSREIPAKLFKLEYFIGQLENDAHVKKYAVKKDIWYCDNISYTIHAKII